MYQITEPRMLLSLLYKKNNIIREGIDTTNNSRTAAQTDKLTVDSCDLNKVLPC